jgi:YidC/Oxa1 family membrane protein insertase
VRDVAMRFAGEKTALVSGLKVGDAKGDPLAKSVREGKPLSFAGVDSLYFAAALVPATGGEAPDLAEVRSLAVGDVASAARKRLVDVTARIVSRPLALEPGRPVRHRYGVFAGPKKPDLLARYGAPGAAMDDLVSYGQGWFGWVVRPMIAILHALHAVIGNYGIAILLLTVLVRGAMYPVSRQPAVASQKMQELQPEMKAIAEKYKDDPTKRTQATQELWRKHDYNPAGGCLLVFLQIPIFMGLYRSLATDVELRQAPLFSSAIRWCSNLAAPDMFWDWSNVLPAFLTAPEGYLGPFLNLFPLATILLFLWQQHLFMPPAMDEQSRVQQQVMKYMMFFMALMFFKVPCGLCLYFIASSLWGIAERMFLAPQAGGTTTAAPGKTRVIDVPFFGGGAKKDGHEANGIHVGEAERRRRQARKKR